MGTKQIEIKQMQLIIEFLIPFGFTKDSLFNYDYEMVEIKENVNIVSGSNFVTSDIARHMVLKYLKTNGYQCNINDVKITIKSICEIGCGACGK